MQRAEHCNFVTDMHIQYTLTPAGCRKEEFVHFHDHYELVLYVQSHNTAYVEGVEHAISDGDLLVIPSRQIHTIHYAATHAYARYVLYLSQAHMQRLLLPMGCLDAPARLGRTGGSKLSLSPAEMARVHGLFISLHEAYNALGSEDMPDTLCNTYTAVILAEVLRLLGRRADAAPRHAPTPLEAMLSYINEHYAATITLEAMERRFYVSRFHICRLFRNAMGTTPIEYLQYKRVAQAQRLLTETALPVLDIGLRCGFNSAQHFYRVFKKLSGCPPAAYRRSGGTSCSTPR